MGKHLINLSLLKPNRFGFSMSLRKETRSLALSESLKEVLSDSELIRKI